MVFSVLIPLVCYLLVVFVVIGCANGRIGVNGFAGIRTSSISHNEETWIAGHRAAKIPTLIGGGAAVICIFIPLVASEESLQEAATLTSVLLLAAGVFIGAFRGTKAAKQVLASQQESL